ncbi:MAG: OmpA family protein, partial [Bacteroidota bacterium]
KKMYPMKWSISALIFLFGITFLTAQNTFTESVYFDLGQHELTDAAKSTLDQFIEDLTYLEDLEITLRANTDAQGSNFYNKKLGERRARSVRQYLAKQKIATKTASVENFGEENPAYSNEEEEGRSKNRRVDIIVNTSSALTLNGLFEEWQQDQEQLYTIDGTKDVRVVGENGTNIWIPKGAFVLADGSQPVGEIELTLKEAYDFSSMLMSDLSTTSGDKLLETGGMVYLNATADGQELEINPEARLTIALPTEEFKEDMQLFTGAQDAHGTVTDWTVTERPFVRSINATLGMPSRPQAPLRIVKMTYTANMPDEPKKVTKPTEPLLPRVPVKDRQRFQPNFWQKNFWTADRKVAMEEQLYERAMNRYHKNVKRYERRLEQYDIQQKEYKDYLDRRVAWLEEKRKIRRDYELADEEAYERQYALYKEAAAKWEEERMERLSRLEDYEVSGREGLSLVSGYFTSITSLGWINCDRFQSIAAEEKMQLAINDLDETEERIFVIFNDTKSLIRTYKRDGQYLTNAIPKGESVTIIGLKFKDKKPMLAQLTTVSNPEMTYDLDFKACTTSEMKAQLSAFN